MRILRMARRVSISLRILVATLALFGSLVGASAASAQELQSGEAADTDWAYDLSHELMSPFCPGSTLAACTSSQAEEVRFWMIAQAAAGASREEVIAVLQERFGDAIRPVPKAEGWGATAFAVPLGLALVGGVGVALALTRMVGGGGGPPSAGRGGGDGARSDANDEPDLARRIDEQIGA